MHNNNNKWAMILFALASLPWWCTAHAQTQLQPCGACRFIETFDGNRNTSPWGREAPRGTAGSLSLIPGVNGAGKALRLTYDLRGGGPYVAAARGTPAVTAPVLWLTLRSSPGMRINVRVRDDTGQVLEYNLVRPITAIDPGQWYRQAIDLAYPSSHWGGRNDGVVHGSIHWLWIGAARPIERLGSAIFGTIDIDDIAAYPTREAWIDPF